jgi:hypothetical protein
LKEGKAKAKRMQTCGLDGDGGLAAHCGCERSKEGLQSL